VGADFYGYYVPYEADIEGALQKLRRREFAAGRYYGAYARERIESNDYDDSCFWPPDCIIEDSNINQLFISTPAHDSIEEAIEDLAEESTKSALDLSRVSHDEHFGVAYMLKPEELIEYMGTDKPDRKQFEDGFFRYAEYMADYVTGIRYTGYCVVIYKDDQPIELFFGGWSAD
jgi:hypothetical protein